MESESYAIGTTMNVLTRRRRKKVVTAASATVAAFVVVLVVIFFLLGSESHVIGMVHGVYQKRY